MYCPETFAERRTESLRELIQGYPLATLVTQQGDQLEAHHIPLFLREREGTMTLHGHVARANPLWRVSRQEEVLVIFQGPQQYISPSWYATKRETGRVVPTWNYLVAHVYGPLVVHDDPAWIRGQMESLTTQQESTLAEPWQVSDAPTEFTERLIEEVVGIEIPVIRWLGKWKVSQNQVPLNRESVQNHLRKQQSPHAQAMAEAVSKADAERAKELNK